MFIVIALITSNFKSWLLRYGAFKFYLLISDKPQWLKSIGNNLKTNPVYFWKYVSSFTKRDKNSQPREVAEAFADYFKTVFKNH
jgi:hypothetical protein